MKQIKVLIVEDEYLIAMQIGNILSAFGHHVCRLAGTGADAISIANMEKPDIALIDIRLVGGMNGIETAKELLSLKKIPIMFMSGYVDDDQMDQMKKLSPVACFSKPLAASAVSSVIDSVFSDEKE